MVRRNAQKGHVSRRVTTARRCYYCYCVRVPTAPCTGRFVSKHDPASAGRPTIPRVRGTSTRRHACARDGTTCTACRAESSVTSALVIRAGPHFTDRFSLAARVHPPTCPWRNGWEDRSGAQGSHTVFRTRVSYVRRIPALACHPLLRVPDVGTPRRNPRAPGTRSVR